MPVVPAPNRARVVPGKPEGQAGGHLLVLDVSGAVGAALNRLRRLVDRNLLVPGHPGQGLEKLFRRIDGILQLARRTPALRWSLLEHSDRVPVAEAEILQLRLLQRGCVRDRDRVGRQRIPPGHARYRGRDCGLAGVQPEHLAVRLHRTAAARRQQRRDAAECEVCAAAEQDDDGKDDNGGSAPPPACSRHNYRTYPVRASR